MGQAFDRDNNVIAEATGETKQQVLDELLQKAPDAERVEIHTMRQSRSILERARSTESA